MHEERVWIGQCDLLGSFAQSVNNYTDERTIELRTSLQLLCIYNRFRELFSIKFSKDLRPGTVGRRAMQLMCGVLRVRLCHHRGGSGECQGSATVPQTGQ